MNKEQKIDSLRKTKKLTKELISLLEDLANNEYNYNKCKIIKDHIYRIRGSLEWFKEDIGDLTR